MVLYSEELKINKDNIITRITNHESNAYKFINTMYLVAISTQNKDKYDKNKEYDVDLSEEDLIEDLCLMFHK